jgi:hypothetical protein
MSAAPTACPWPIRAAAVATIACLLLLVGRFWHPVYGFTAFFQLDAANDDLKITAFRELPVYVYRDTGGYDGLYYAQLAQDPTLRDPQLPRAIDNLGYRARRILPSALAWVLGAGDPARVVFAFSVLNLLAWGALAFVLWRLLEVRDARGWFAWAGVLFSAGALGSVRLALTDLVALAIIAAALLAARHRRGTFAAGALAAAALARETSLLALAAPTARPWLSWRNLVRIAVAAAPLAAWLAYVRIQTGPTDPGWNNFTWPLAGLAEKWREVFRAIGSLPDRPLAWTTLLATLALTVQAAYFALRPRLDDAWWRLGAAYTGLMLFLGTAVWEGFPGAATRVLLPLNLAFNVLVHRTRAPVAWLLAGNLTICAGLLALRDVPHDAREIAAVGAREVACVARMGHGWYGRERTNRHAWLWSAGRGGLELEAWPRTDATVRLEFSMRSLGDRRVALVQDGREVWSADIGPLLSHHVVPLSLPGGRATIAFVTSTPPQRENASAEARELAFALYDPRLRPAAP